MPFDLISDFTATPGVDRRWSSLALSFAEALTRVEPRLRFRLRRIVPYGTHERDSLLLPETLPEVLRPHAALPDRRYYEAWNYRCKQCGIEGIPHSRRLLHDKHEGYERASFIKKSGFGHVGIIRPWKVTHNVWFGPPDRVAGRATGLSYAITAGQHAVELDGFAVVALLPIRAGFNMVNVSRATEVVLLPKGIEAAAKSFLETYLKVDPEALDPVDEVEVERAEQLRRAQQADQHLIRKGFAKPVAKPPTP